MPLIEPLHLAENVTDLEQLVDGQKLIYRKTDKMLENASKKLYQTISQKINDEEFCFILCMRYMYVMNRLCKTGDGKFYKIYFKSELNKIESQIEELRERLKIRYEEKHLRDRLQKPKKKIQSAVSSLPSKIITGDQSHYFDEFISVKQLHSAINNKVDMLIVDIRPTDQYQESQIKFENIINIPEELIESGLSANAIENKLKDETAKLWNKRDCFTLLVFLDWNSGSENVIGSKLNSIKESIVEWDINRQYKQQPLILNGGFKEFLDSYPSDVTNVHVNYIRYNENIDELLELENISYPDANISVMELKEFTIDTFEDTTHIEETEKFNEISPPDNDQGIDDNYRENSAEERIAPKGGDGGTVISNDNKKDEYLEHIQNKIEEDRQRLLIEARSKKNQLNDQQHIEDTNKKANNNNNNENYKPQQLVVSNKILPPPIRRETKPKKSVVLFGGWCGLVNIKNTCYMNTILQCLKCIPVIRHLIQSNINQFITRRPTQIINDFNNVIKMLCEGTEFDKRTYRPSGFYDVVCRLDPIYKKGNHEDCMEFFLFLFNYLNEDCAHDIKKKNVMIEREKSWYAQLQGRTSVWVDLFYHQFQCTKICLTCHLKVDTYETDNTLMLSVPYKPSLRIVHLNDLIKEYVEDNQILDYKCSRCHKMQVINRKKLVVEPEILVIVLKRYYQDEYQETRKNNVLINFDLSFQFGNYFYKLYSVAQHKGTMEHGHYYGHGLLNNNTWIEFNDERITKFEKEWDSIKGSVCAFFYCKKKFGRV